MFLRLVYGLEHRGRPFGVESEAQSTTWYCSLPHQASKGDLILAQVMYNNTSVPTIVSFPPLTWYLYTRESQLGGRPSSAIQIVAVFFAWMPEYGNLTIFVDHDRKGPIQPASTAQTCQSKSIAGRLRLGKDSTHQVVHRVENLQTLCAICHHEFRSFDITAWTSHCNRQRLETSILNSRAINSSHCKTPSAK